MNLIYYLGILLICCQGVAQTTSSASASVSITIVEPIKIQYSIREELTTPQQTKSFEGDIITLDNITVELSTNNELHYQISLHPTIISLPNEKRDLYPEISYDSLNQIMDHTNREISNQPLESQYITLPKNNYNTQKMVLTLHYN
jgi:hypothetical protein